MTDARGPMDNDLLQDESADESSDTDTDTEADMGTSDDSLPDDSLLDDLADVDAESSPYGDEETAARATRHGNAARLRPTGRGWAVLGAAGGVIAVLGVVGAMSLRGPNAPVAAGGTTSASPAAVSTSAAPSLHIEMSGRAYTAANLATLAQTLLDAPGPHIGIPTVESPSIGPIGTPIGLRECLGTLGESDAPQVAADIATFDGQPAAVIVVVESGIKQVYAVGRTCTKGDPAIIMGPLPMS